MRSLQSMFIAASVEGFTFDVDDGEYVGKNPRDAFQVARHVEEVVVTLIKDGKIVDRAFILPFEDDYMADCFCDGFFDKWSSN
jgi:hypothetical protein